MSSLVIQPVSLVTSNATLRALTSPIRQYVTKIEWFNWAEDTVTGDYTADIVDGSLSIDSANDVRRSFSMTVNNANGLYIPNGSRTNMGAKIRIKRGIVTSLGIIWWNRGIFVLTDPLSSHKGAEKTVNLSGVDKWALHNGDLGGTLEDTTTIAINTNISEAIRAIAEDGGETKFAFDVTTEVTPYTITKETGDTRADLMKELALIISWDLYYDVDGYLRFRPLLDPLQKQVVADLSVGGAYRKCYSTSEYSPEWTNIKNKWKVIGYADSDTGEIFDGTFQDDNPNSPTNTATPPLGIGLKIGILNDDNITTDDLCHQRAGYELRKNLTKIDRSTHEIFPLPFLNDGDCVQLEDSANGIIDDKYEIQSITEPLGLGMMQIQTWQVKGIWETVAFDDFTLGVGTWQQLESGSVDIYGIAGNNCLRKTTNTDPNGGYRLLDKEVNNFELVVYTRKDDAGNGLNSYSIVDSSGNGYGITLDYDNDLLILQERTAWVASTIDSVTFNPTLVIWYTLRLNKMGNNFLAEIHAGKTLTFSDPLVYIDGVDSTTSSFDRVSVNGGNVFYSDDITVRMFY